MKRQLCLVLTLACWMALVPDAVGQQFGPWSERYNVGRPVNSEFTESQAFISKDGLSLYFTRLDCDGCSSGVAQDIWVAHRDSLEGPWHDALRLPAPINSSNPEGLAFLTIDGHYLLFASQRPGGVGKNDIYISRRKDKNADDQWEEPVNLGPPIDSPSGDRAPVLFHDESTGQTILYFTSNRSGNDDIYTSELQPDGTWGPVGPVAELNSPSGEVMGTLSRDGLEIYFVSNRPGSMVAANGQVSDDIWMSSRASTSEPWSAPERATALNSANFEGRPSLSFDGTAIYFNTVNTVEECEERGQCNVSPSWDIWMATREKLTGPKK